MKAFPMTCDRFHFWTPLLITPPLLIPVVVTHGLPGPAGTIARVALGGVGAILVLATLLVPRSVQVSFSGLELVRVGWPSLHLALSELISAERGPELKLGGTVRRVGGWFWSGGLFRAQGIGNVRAWMTRLGPTVLLRRRQGLPILLGVDDVEGLLHTLGQRGIRAP